MYRRLLNLRGRLRLLRGGITAWASVLANRSHQLIGVIAFICNHGFWRMFREQFLGAVNIVLLAGAEAQFQRLSLGIYRQMQLRAEPASRVPEGFSVRLFLGAARAAC